MIPFILGISMFGLGCVAAAVSISPASRVEGIVVSWLPALCLSSSLAILFVFAATTWMSAGMDLNIGRILSSGGGASAVARYQGQESLARAFILGALLAVPNLLGGMVIAALFRVIDAERLPALYGIDLLGACSGSLICVFVMEYGGYRWPLALVVGLPLVAGAALAQRREGEWRAGLALAFVSALFVVFGPASARLEPRPNLQMVGRTYQAYAGGETSSEEWHAWNSFGRVAELVIKDPPGAIRRVFAFGSGSGHAAFDAYAAGERRGSPLHQTAPLSILGVPKRALVLFAGVGSEVIALDQMSGGRMDITAIEINRQIVDRALGRREYGLGALFAKENVHFKIAEARTFLERDSSRYDLILIPYFGSVNVTPWASGGLAKFMFTREAMRGVLGHITREGMCIIYDVNKVVLLANARSIPGAFGKEDPADCAIVMSLAPVDRRDFLHPEAGRSRPGSQDWSTPSDNSALFLKPSGFSAAELTRFRSFAKDRHLEILYAPDMQDIDNPYRQVLRAGRLAEALAELRRISQSQKKRSIRLAPRTDDFPSLGAFHLDSQSAAHRSTLFMAAIMLAGLALALAVVLPGSRRRTLPGDLLWLCYFAALGYGYMFVEIGFILKFSLFLGEPVYSMSVSLAALLFFSGLGSLTRGAAPGAGPDVVRNASLGTVLALVAVVCFVEKAGGVLFLLPQGLRATAIALLLAPVGFFMGQLFAQGLVLAQRHGRDWTARAWAVSSFSSAGAVAAAGLLPQYSGFRSLLWLGAGLYLAIFTGACLSRSGALSKVCRK